MNRYNEVNLDNKISYLDMDNKKGKIYFDTILSESKSTKLYNKLIEKTPWEHGVYNMFGKEVKTPRLLWAMKEDGFDIEKSYTITGSSVWSKEVEKLKTKVEKIIKKKIRYAQINYYRNGNDYIGWHTDSEVIEGDLIASISIGATRKFQFRAIDKNNKEKYQINLTNGSLIVFDYSAAKKDWKHRIPKEPKVEDGRINITFRLR